MGLALRSRPPNEGKAQDCGQFINRRAAEARQGKENSDRLS